jgi:hypothetical protein
MRPRVQNALHAIVLTHGVRRGHALWNPEGQALLASLPLPTHTAERRRLRRHTDGRLRRLFG